MPNLRAHVTTGRRRPTTSVVHHGVTPPPLRRKHLRADAEEEIRQAARLVRDRLVRFCPRSPRREAAIAELERLPRLFELLAVDPYATQEER